MARTSAARKVEKTEKPGKSRRAADKPQASKGQPNGAKTKTWQQTKSERTRKSILDAAVDCFFELGYFNTTTEHIARKAGVSRGAMLHHFATRFDLIKAAVDHINQIRLAIFAQEETAIQSGAEHSRVEEGIDVYWRQLNTPAFVVFTELKIAARTDRELEKILIPALKAYDKAWYQTVSQVFPDLAQSEAFARTNYLTQYLLEGMAMARATRAPKVPEAMLLDWLKAELRRSYQDVLTTVKRND
jgi:AcrR family transcriptional regulator